MGLHLQTVAAVAPFLIADLGLSYGEIGVLIGSFLLPGVFLALPGGLISRRIGDKATLLAALGLLAVGTGLLATSASFGTALVARLLSGAGGTLLTMQVAKIATDWFTGRELSTAIGLLLGTFPFGAALAMATLGGVAAASSWRTAVVLIAASAVPIFLVVAFLLRDLPRATAATDLAPDRRGSIGGIVNSPVIPKRSEGSHTDPLRAGRIRAAFDHASFNQAELGAIVLVGAAFALVNAALVVFSSFMPTLLIGRGYSETDAGVLASWTSWTLIPAVVVAGVLLDRVRRLMSWLLLSALATAATCFLLPLVDPSRVPIWAWIVLFGIVSAPVTVGTMALPGQVLRPENRSLGFGLYFTMNYIGFSLLPPVGGYLLDLTGDRASPIWFSGVLYLVIVGLLIGFEWTRRPPNVTPRPACAADG